MSQQQNKVPETIQLVILQSDKDGQLTALNHPVLRQFSSEYMMIVARALKELSKGIKTEAQAKALQEASAAAAVLK
jgi:hypothetical protein